jgi:murein DD-endopeptidase MepM/ murein hydrolase activator NlpD
MLALANSVHRTPPSNTAALLAALAPLEKLGLTTEQAEIAGMGQFPVAGPAYYTDDWLELRPGPPPALHPGIDIDAALGTPLRSPVDGTLTYDTSDPTGYGLDAIVTGPDKTFYRMAHMSGTVSGLHTGSAVKSGQVIGFVGSSGNSTGPHCHFEVHPLGGAGIDGKPILDGWQAAAIKAIPALVLAIQGIPDPTATPTAIGASPLHLAVPAPQAAFFPPLPLAPLAQRAPVPSSPQAGLAVAALLALLATSLLAADRFGPWSGRRRVAVDPA